MQKPSLNVMIFDDDQQVSNSNQMKKYTSISMSKNVKQSSISKNNEEKNCNNGKINNISKNDEQNIKNQLKQLQIKINKLQKQGENIKKQFQKNDFTSSNVINKTSNNNQNNQQYKQIQQVLFTVQKKIQLIIQQSRKLITKLTQNIDKKLYNYSNTKCPQSSNPHKNIKNSSLQMPQHFKQKIHLLQQKFLQRNSQYQQILQKKHQALLNQYTQKQSQMLTKLTQIQQKFINKINTYETKQKQYINWIHYLQGKLKQKEKNKKKMITITQEKPQIHEIINKNYGQNQNYNVSSNLENIPVNNTNYQTVKNNMSVDHHNNSKITRKHKIFGNKQVSPVAKQQKVTPTKDIQHQKNKINKQFNTFNYETTSQNINIPSQPTTTTSTRPIVHTNNFLPQPQTLPLKTQSKPSNLGFYNQLRSQTQRQFYKNIPQANSAWDKFADMNQLSGDYNQSQSDDFFNPIENYQYENCGQFIDSYDQRRQNNDKGQQYQVLNSKSNNYQNNVNDNNNVNNNNDNGYNKIYQQQHSNNNSNNTNHQNIHKSGGQEKVFSPFDLN